MFRLYCREGYASLEEVTELASAYAVKIHQQGGFLLKQCLFEYSTVEQLISVIYPLIPDKQSLTMR